MRDFFLSRNIVLAMFENNPLNTNQIRNSVLKTDTYQTDIPASQCLKEIQFYLVLAWILLQ